MRHLADYVLVWSTRFVGNGGDDIAKSPHMARIGKNSSNNTNSHNNSNNNNDDNNNKTST